MEALLPADFPLFELIVVLVALKDILHYEYLYHWISREKLKNIEHFKGRAVFFAVSTTLTVLAGMADWKAAICGWLIALVWEVMSAQHDKNLTDQSKKKPKEPQEGP